MPTLIPLKALSTLRMLVGASCLFIPRQAGALWGVPVAAGGEAVLFGRMVGVRDFVLGAYLWRRIGEVEKSKANMLEGSGSGGQGVRTGLLNKHPIPGGMEASTASVLPNDEMGYGGSTITAVQQHETAVSNVRSALWLGLICDLADIASVGMCWVEGSPISALGEFCIGGGAAVFVAIAGQFLWVGRRI